MKTNLEQGAAAFASANRLPSGIPPVAVCALGFLDRYGEPSAGYDPIIDYTADGPLLIRSGTHTISKGSAAAMTLAAPNVGDNGVRLTIVANSLFAHVVVFTGANIFGGAGAKTTLTLAAQLGSGVVVVAVNGKWLLEGQTTIGTLI